MLNHFFHIGKYEVLFYVAVIAIVLLLMYPQLFTDSFDKYVTPAVDKAAMNWLQQRGLEMTAEEQKVED